MMKQQKELRQLLHIAQNQAKPTNSSSKQLRGGTKSKNDKNTGNYNNNNRNDSTVNNSNNNNNSKTSQYGVNLKQYGGHGNIVNDQLTMNTSGEETIYVLKNISRSF